MTTVAAALDAAVARFGARPFLHVLPETAAAYGIASGVIGYARAAAEIARLRAVYGAAGYRKGHRIGLMLENRPAFFLHWFALNGLGVGVVPLNPELRPAELAYLIGHSEIVLAVAPTRHLPLLSAVPAMAEDAVPPPAPPPGTTAPDECALLYTSGTTGRPKGCVLSNAYFLRAGDWYANVGGLCSLREGAERLLTPLPLVHMNAMACSAMAMVVTGGCLIQLDRFHPKTWWHSVRESGASVLHYLGVMPSMLMGAPESPADRDHAVRFGFGAGVDRRLHAPFEARFGFPLLEAWAMTETGAGAVVIASREPRHVGTSCFGRPEPAVATRIVDDAGVDCAAGTPGELLVRAAGPDPRAGFFTEYLKDAAATREAWEGGWFHTGDVVRADDEGHLYFVDRKKNVIRRSGENIAAVEVESVLRRHPSVAEVAVAATPDPMREQEVLACIIAREPVAPEAMRAMAEAIVRAALEDLSYHKVPGWVAFVDTLPMTASQKIARGELRAMAERLPGSAACIDTRPLKRR